MPWIASWLNKQGDSGAGEMPISGTVDCTVQARSWADVVGHANLAVTL